MGDISRQFGQSAQVRAAILAASRAQPSSHFFELAPEYPDTVRGQISWKQNDRVAFVEPYRLSCHCSVGHGALHREWLWTTRSAKLINLICKHCRLHGGCSSCHYRSRTRLRIG